MTHPQVNQGEFQLTLTVNPGTHILWLEVAVGIPQLVKNLGAHNDMLEQLDHKYLDMVWVLYMVEQLLHVDTLIGEDDLSELFVDPVRDQSGERVMDCALSGHANEVVLLGLKECLLLPPILDVSVDDKLSVETGELALRVLLDGHWDSDLTLPAEKDGGLRREG